MAEITWSPEGQEIFEKLITAVPEPMRDVIKPKLLEMLQAKAGGKPVTSEIITKMVQDDLPEPQKSMLLQAIGTPPPAESKETQEQGAPSVDWSGKSQAMFEIMIGEVPEAMREVFRGKLTAVIIEKAQGNPVAENHVTAVVNEIVPEPFKSTILKKFKEVGDFDIKVIDDIIARYGTSRDKLMYILHDIQDEVGYLPVEALRAVGNKCEIKLSAIYNIATFYKSFRLDPPGKHNVKICRGTACHLKDGNGFVKEIEEKATQSSEITVEKTLCLGCCDCAPVVEVDGRLLKGDEAKAKIDSILS